MDQKKTQKDEEVSSKRPSSANCQSSLFRVVNRLCSLCAIETALVISTASGDAFCFCHPCVGAILKRLDDPENSDFHKHLAEHEATLRELKRQYSRMLEQVKAQKQRGRDLERLEKLTCGKSLLDVPIDDLNCQELRLLQKFMEEVKGNLMKQIAELSVQTTNATASSSKSAKAINPSSINQQAGETFADVNDHDNGHEC